MIKRKTGLELTYEESAILDFLFCHNGNLQKIIDEDIPDTTTEWVEMTASAACILEINIRKTIESLFNKLSIHNQEQIERMKNMIKIKDIETAI